MRWPLSVFNSTPLGRILNRFSNDVNTLDNTLPMSLQSGFRQLSTVILGKPVHY